jgi:DNA-binding beta-propeller fold protein YncE
MKLSSFLKNTSQMFLIFLTLAACQAWAASPLGHPVSLAVDSKGNLYVVNFDSNQILVYNPNYVQQTKKTISAGVSGPFGVAFDSKGNLYVANICVTTIRGSHNNETRFSLTASNQEHR